MRINKRDDRRLSASHPIDAGIADADGRRLVSRAAVSEITERLWKEYEACTRRDLSEFDIVYLFVDGIAERLRAGCPHEPVIVRLGVGRNGQKVLLHLMSGSDNVPPGLLPDDTGGWTIASVSGPDKPARSVGQGHIDTILGEADD